MLLNNNSRHATWYKSIYPFSRFQVCLQLNQLEIRFNLTLSFPIAKSGRSRIPLSHAGYATRLRSLLVKQQPSKGYATSVESVINKNWGHTRRPRTLQPGISVIDSRPDVSFLSWVRNVVFGSKKGGLETPMSGIEAISFDMIIPATGLLHHPGF